jgi:sugar (pentulose or hexulose) kinase
MSTRNKGLTGQLVVGLDSSTTATKAIAFDHHGKIVAQAHESILLSAPQPGQFEQDPSDWWTSARRALKDLSRQIDPRRIVALGISNQRESFVPLCRNGLPLRPAILWLDERCRDEVKPFSDLVGAKRIHRITGKPVDYAPVVYRLAWMKRHEPSLFRRIGMICDVHTYLVSKLTGLTRTSWASADPLGLFDLKRKIWSPQILLALGLQKHQLPEVYPSGCVLGRLTHHAAHVTGLAAGTLIVSGGGDGQCAGLGSNALAPERAYLNLGTAAVAGVYGEMYKTSRAFRTMAACDGRGYCFECSLRSGTFALDWFLRNVLKINPTKLRGSYKSLEDEARRIPEGSEGLLFLPYLCGAMNPYWDMDARGAFVGLSATHTRSHFYRAILEGIAFEQKFAISAAEEELGVTVADLVMIGGGATSNLWCSIMADVTGKNVCIPATSEASALGAAIAAAVGAKWYRRFTTAARKMTHVRKVIPPHPQRHDFYSTRFALYRKIYPALHA